MCSDVLKTRINISIDPHILKLVDPILIKYGLSRSNAIETWFKQVIDDPEILDQLKNFR